MSRLSLLTVLALSVASSLSRAQEKFFREDRKFADADTKIKDALPKPPADAPLTDDLKTAIEIFVRHSVYPMADPDKKVQNNPMLMSRQVDLCEARIRNIFPSKDKLDEVKNTPMQDEFIKRMLTELEKLLLPEPDPFPITRVNAARVVARLAAMTGREETADLLVKIIAEPKKGEKDPKQVEGAKYYALQGLKDLQRVLGSTQTPPIKDAKRRGEAIEALVAFVERKPPYAVNTEDEAEGLRVIRREAIRALAEVREARLTGSPNGHVALTLARVVGKDKLLVPEPRLDEQLEAAVGLGRMPNDPAKEFQPGYAAYLIAGFVADFARKYQESRTLREPWKVHGARLRDALKAMEAASGGDVVVKTVQGLSDKILEDVEKGGRLINPKPLSDWLDSNQPTQKTIYKSEANSSVMPRGATPEKGM
jgi:hypothetical protein